MLATSAGIAAPSLTPAVAIDNATSLPTLSLSFHEGRFISCCTVPTPEISLIYGYAVTPLKSTAAINAPCLILLV